MNISVKIDVAKAAVMWGEGVTLENMAARLGAPKDTVRSVVRRNRDLFPKRERVPVLTAERLEEASRMWRAGHTASIIGERFGLDRKTICRVAFEHRELFPRKTTAAMLAARKPKQRRAAAEIPPDIDADIPASAFDAERLPFAKTLIGLEHGECKWPVNHGGPFLFCAEVTAEKQAYCKYHSWLSLPRHLRETEAA